MYILNKYVYMCAYRIMMNGTGDDCDDDPHMVNGQRVADGDGQPRPSKTEKEHVFSSNDMTYPLVNLPSTMETSTIFDGKTRVVSTVPFSNRKLLVILRGW